MKRTLFTIAGAALMFSSAHAGDIVANHQYTLGQNAKFTTDLPGHVGGRDQQTVQFDAQRTGGTDTLVPTLFKAYCVEIGETIGTGSQAHPNVTPLLGSTTTNGGISGPVNFDAVRTSRLQTLWGSFFNSIGGSNDRSAAFQLAVWELSFDDDVTLVEFEGSKLFVKNDQYQSGITDIAEGWLSDIRNGVATQQQDLALLSGPGIQDLITPVPEPGTIAALGLGAAALLRRRKTA
ncbi:MAG TPA: PEP-CTERM sorting domain-containing protein [Fimbriimonadaceae bacterium]|nr:PEP-CTERM sorting domain-containing protein [Fimbriimonadaceae bacterium]